MAAAAVNRQLFRAGLLPVALFLASPVPAFCQAAGASTLQAQAEEVTLDLVARDHKGHIVQDLHPEDLQIFDEGNPTKLTSLRLHSVRSQPGTTLVVLLFDALPADAGKLARQAAGEIVNDAAGDIDFAVFVLTPRVRLVGSVTHDRNLLTAAIDRATAATRAKGNLGYDAPENALRVLASGAPQSATTAGQNEVSESTDTSSQMARVMSRALGSMAEYSMAQNAMPGLAALLALTQHLGGSPGRKSIVYFSDAPPTDVRSRNFIERVRLTANRSSVSIYGFDVSGISLWARTQSARMLTAANASVRNIDNTPPRILSNGNLDSLETQERSLLSGPDSSDLRELMSGTGGFFVENSNDLRKAARRLVDDVSSYYDATFVPSAHSDAARFHAIAVKTSRRGLRIQARTGYWSGRSSAEATEPFEAALSEVLSKAETSEELAVHTSVLCLDRGPDNQVSTSLAVEIPLHQMEFQEDANSKLFSMHFALLVTVRDNAGAIVRKFSRDIPYRASLDDEDRTRQDVYSFTGQFSAMPGDYRVETAVVDLNSGKAGARRDGVTIEPVSAGPWLSDVSIVRRFEPLLEEDGESELLRYRDAKLVPDLTREFEAAREAPLWVFFRLHRALDDPAGQRVWLEIRRNGKSLFRSELKTSVARAGEADSYLASVTPKQLAPGRYEAVALAEAGARTIGKSVAFEIEGAPIIEEATALADPDGTTSPEDPAETSTESETSPGTEGTALPGPVPNAGEQTRILEGARARALEFTGSLPNFSCIETTRRYTAPDDRHWKSKDSFVELLEFVDGEERRNTLEVDGHRSELLRSEIPGAASAGEYGALLRAVFGSEAAASFAWKEWTMLNGRTVAVFSYYIDRAHSRFAMRVGARVVNTAARGSVYIDPMTMTAHRINMVADEIPKGFPYRESSVAVDYEYTTIGEHDYALPLEAQVQIRRANGSYQKNELTFRDYKRFSAKSSVTFTNK